MKTCPSKLEGFSTMQAAVKKVPPHLTATIVLCPDCNQWHICATQFKDKGPKDELGRPIRRSPHCHWHD